MPEAVLRFPEGRFEGEVDDKQIPNGEGCLEFPGNDEKERQSYDGDFKDKKAHGKGLMRWRQGDKYEGEFKEGLRHGKGTYISKVSQEKDKKTSLSHLKLHMLLNFFNFNDKTIKSNKNYKKVLNTNINVYELKSLQTQLVH